MDLNAYVAAHEAEWDRLEQLAARPRLTGREADELIEGYQAGITHLSTLSTTAGSTRAGERLSVILSRARLRFTSTGENMFAALPKFFVSSLPAALYRLRWITLGAALASVVVGLLFAVWIVSDPQMLAALAAQSDLDQLVNHDFVDYYSENPASSFMGQVWTNNAMIAAQCVAFGLLGVYTPYVLLQNAVNVGMSGGVLFAYGQGDVFFSYIFPHGLLELTAVFVAAAAGMRLFWTLVAPGARPRGQALAEDGRAVLTVVIGLIITLFVSGIIEGFVTPSALPVWAKITIGAVALTAFLAYMLVLGGRAHRAGATGDLSEDDAGARRIYAG